MPLMTEPKRRPKKKASDEPARQRAGKPLNVWLQSELRDALDAMLEKTRRSLTAEVSIALEEYLAKNGLWPPPAVQQED